MSKIINKLFLVAVCLFFFFGGLSQAQLFDTIAISKSHSGSAGEIITVPIDISNPATRIQVFGMTVSFDSNMLELMDCGPGTLVPDSGWRSFDYDEVKPGLLNIFASAHAEEFISPNSNGSLVALTFVVTCDDCENGDKSDILLSQLQGDIENFGVSNGEFTFVVESDCIHSGDTNQDGKITSADAQLAFEIVLSTYTPTYEEACAADCNGDDKITSTDAQNIFLVVLSQASCVDPLP